VDQRVLDARVREIAVGDAVLAGGGRRLVAIGLAYGWCPVCWARAEPDEGFEDGLLGIRSTPGRGRSGNPEC
jgi:tRNA G37 N-methylase TrmD